MPIVRIQRQLLRDAGQGVLLGDLRTECSRRTLHPSQPLVDLLQGRRVREDFEEQGTRIWPKPDNLVFASTIGMPLDPEARLRPIGYKPDRG